MKINLDVQVRQACRHLLSEINRDPASASYGCFDRRYWAWKLTDFPEATFQRNLANLAWLMGNGGEGMEAQMVAEVIVSGLLYTARIQHHDGSFDQAFPYERSFGATGFLLPDLVKAYLAVRDHCSEADKSIIEKLLRNAADFLCRSAEEHGLISNHLAGAALGLYRASDLFQDSGYGKHARQLLQYVLSNQSSEGWLPEYGGADPGYQTLCMHYLSQIYRLSPTEELKQALERSLDFLQYFAHPDGSFGGEYGSRRTEVYYPGGIALLSDEFPLAASLHRFMRANIENLNTVTLVDIDVGNMAPLLSSTILALDSAPKNANPETLPWEKDNLTRSFSEAGIAVKGNSRYYAVIGASNGGVLKVFDKDAETLVTDDCGALAELGDGRWISTQSTRLDNSFTVEGNVYKVTSDFFAVNRQQTTPFNYLVLRILNLTLMRVRFLNEALKKLMVAFLVRNDRRFPLRRERTMKFSESRIQVTDQYASSGQLHLNCLEDAGRFNAIHMASSRYFSGWSVSQKLRKLDHERLNGAGDLEVEQTIDLKKGKR